MTIEEIYKIKEKINEKMSKMTSDEINNEHKKISKKIMNVLGEENFIATDKPYIFKHIAKR